MATQEGRYLYGILASERKLDLGPMGIGEGKEAVYTLPYKDTAAIISHSPIVKYPVSRENSLAHAKVLDKAVEEGTVLPVKFCTIAEKEEDIVEKVLKDRYQEFTDLMKEMEGKMELGVRARWKNLDAIYAEIVEENERIKLLKEALLKEKDQQKKYAGSIQVGELVQKALEQKKKKEAEELMEALRPLGIQSKENQFYGDMNLLNAVFLVDRSKEHEFDAKVNELQEKYTERMQLKYTVSRIPYNFVEVEIRW